jgi:hypothetical protein
MNQKLIIVIVVIIIGLAIPGYFLLSSQSSGDAVVASAPTSEAEAVFVNLANQLVPLGFDTAILSDPRFTALVDLHTAVLPETLGRHDPFAPFGK